MITRFRFIAWGMAAVLLMAGGGASMAQSESGGSNAEVTTDSGLK